MKIKIHKKSIIYIYINKQKSLDHSLSIISNQKNKAIYFQLTNQQKNPVKSIFYINIYKKYKEMHKNKMLALAATLSQLPQSHKDSLQKQSQKEITQIRKKINLHLPKTHKAASSLSNLTIEKEETENKLNFHKEGSITLIMGGRFLPRSQRSQISNQPQSQTQTNLTIFKEQKKKSYLLPFRKRCHSEQLSFNDHIQEIKRRNYERGCEDQPNHLLFKNFVNFQNANMRTNTDMNMKNKNKTKRDKFKTEDSQRQNIRETKNTIVQKNWLLLPKQNQNEDKNEKIMKKTQKLSFQQEVRQKILKFRAKCPIQRKKTLYNVKHLNIKAKKPIPCRIDSQSYQKMQRLSKLEQFYLPNKQRIKLSMDFDANNNRNKNKYKDVWRESMKGWTNGFAIQENQNQYLHKGETTFEEQLLKNENIAKNNSRNRNRYRDQYSCREEEDQKIFQQQKETK